MATQIQLSRSPYYVKLVPTTTPQDMVRSTTEVRLWQGAETIPTGTADFTISKTPVGGDQFITLEFSQLINDKFNQQYNGLIYTDDVWFLYYECEFFDSVGTQIGTSITPPEPLVFTQGYGNFNQGVNPYYDTGNIVTGNSISMMSSQLSLRLPEPEIMTIPVLICKNETATVVWYNGTLAEAKANVASTKTKIETYTNGGLSEEYIHYFNNQNPNLNVPAGHNTNATDYQIYVEMDQAGVYEDNSVFWCPENDNPNTVVKISYSGDQANLGTYYEINYLTKDKYDPYKITFVNKYGALESIWMMGAFKESLAVKNDQFKRNLLDRSVPSYNTEAHQYVTFGDQGTKSISLNTGWIPESMNVTLQELFLSQKIWLTNYNPEPSISANVINEPVIIKSKNLEFKRHINDRMINYNLQFQYAFDMINQVR
ncbi:MAG: hypothetical protein Unbinned805contig1001_21 [Prokaryotic dsDNA virus sp.]|jgi:hypothetical protein|nr:MAG: hypothetical protein Unbinned805contig1001_21 [Prokaryotic dsDNA virus sp.]|tara:strand:- start:443 stop:1726 length:1284 start_codon:yes stop_codon:yes gene_type:complete